MAKIKTDCFAYDTEKQSCKALNQLYCKHESECRFYKNEKRRETSCTTYNASSRG